MSDPKRRDSVAIAEKWWRALILEEHGRRATRGSRRAAMSRLRRAATPLEVMYEPEALRLIASLPNEKPRIGSPYSPAFWRSLIRPTTSTLPRPSVATHSTKTHRPSCPKRDFAACCKPTAKISWTRCVGSFV